MIAPLVFAALFASDCYKGWVSVLWGAQVNNCAVLLCFRCILLRCVCCCWGCCRFLGLQMQMRSNICLDFRNSPASSITLDTWVWQITNTFTTGKLHGPTLAYIRLTLGMVWKIPRMGMSNIIVLCSSRSGLLSLRKIRPVVRLFCGSTEDQDAAPWTVCSQSTDLSWWEFRVLLYFIPLMFHN